MNTETISIQSMSPRGHGIAVQPDGSEVNILGAYIDDVVRARVYKKAEGIIYAELTEIVTPSAFRTHTPKSLPFFDANAPWRYLNSEKEYEIKEQLLQKIFSTHIKEGITSKIPINKESAEYHYRNKAAYSFLERNGALHFALYTRGTSGAQKVVQQDNLLVHKTITTAGNAFLIFFNQKKASDTLLKYLTLRYSYHTNSVVAHILVTESSRKKLPWKKSDLEAFLLQNTNIKGILVSQSEAHVRSAHTTKDFYYIGDITITEKVSGKTYQYHPSQFFQIYPYAFEDILADAVSCVTSIKNHQEYNLLDLFAGVGIIGIHLASYVHSVQGVEQSPLSKVFALQNAKNNGNKNFEYHEADVDEVCSYIQKKQILVIDPPRSGLSKKTIQTIQEVLPEYILYISCNPETQARDVSILIENYDIQESKGYNLFPKTPHIESLVFLKRKD